MDRWLRILAIACLMMCVYCKMIDLDCALFNPVHCQSVLESDDNSFAHFQLDHPLWTDPPVLIVKMALIEPDQPVLLIPCYERWLPTDPHLRKRQTALSKRPPPPQLT